MSRRVWLVAVVVGVALLALTARDGALRTFDSETYLSAAQSIRDGSGVAVDGAALTVFPLVYPTALAVFVGPGGALVLNGLALAGIAAATGLLAVRRGAPPELAVIVAGSGAALFVARAVWSETLFVAFVLGWAVAVDRLEVSARWVYVAAGFAATAALTRYAGMAVLAVHLLVLARHRAPLGRRVGAAAIAVLPFVAWLARNYSADGTLMGQRADSVDTLRTVAGGTLSTIGWWALPLDALRNPYFGIVVVVAIGVAVWVRRSRFERLDHVWLFAAVFVAQLVASQLSTKLNFVDARLMAPLFVPLAIAVAVALNRRPALTLAAVQLLGGAAFAWRG